MRPAHVFVSAFCAVCLIVAGSNGALSQCVLPNQLTNGQTADATQVMANFNALAACINNGGPGGSANAIQYNAGSATFGGVGPLNDGQVVVGATGGTPQATGLSAGSGISITNGPGSVTISATGAGAVSPFYDPASIPITTPTASSFTVQNGTGSTGTLTNMVSRGMTLTVPTGSPYVDTAIEQAVPSSSAFTVTALVYPASYMSGAWFWGLAVKDVSGKYVGLGFSSTTKVAYYTFSNISTVNTFSSTTSILNGQNPVWLRLQLTGGNFVFTFSFDGEHFNPGSTVSATAYLSSSLSTVGFIVDNNNTGKDIVLDVLSWTSVTP
jgi:hypothetical protein